MTHERDSIIVIVGPTASGKSSLAIALAQRLDGEIVSADSMQVYRGLDIGTAKVPGAERMVRHYGIDVADLAEPFSAALFQELARDAFDEIARAGKVRILSGGTGFYIRAAIDAYDFVAGEQAGNPVRERYNALAQASGSEAVWRRLQERDPASAEMIHPNDVKRVVRALEMLEAGESYAEQRDNLKRLEQALPAIFIGIDVERDVLRERIDRRVDAMVDQGLVGEVRSLVEAGLKEAITSQQAIGYKEIVAALDGETTMDEAIERIKTATKRYAKRQRTWFRADKRIHWINGTDGDIDAMLDAALRVLAQEGFQI